MYRGVGIVEGGKNRIGDRGLLLLLRQRGGEGGTAAAATTRQEGSAGTTSSVLQRLAAVCVLRVYMQRCKRQPHIPEYISLSSVKYYRDACAPK